MYSPPTKVQADNVARSSHVITKDANLAIYMMNLNEIKAPVLQDERGARGAGHFHRQGRHHHKLAFGEGNYTGPVSWGLEF